MISILNGFLIKFVIENMKKYIDVILPLPIPGTFTYSVPSESLELIQIGSRVVVPFGPKKYYTAIISHIHTEKPIEYEVKPLFSVLDSYPIVLPNQLQFWNWISEYYLSALGDVYKAAIPSGLKLESETMVELNNDYIGDTTLTENEVKILDLLTENPIQNITKLARDSQIENILPIANRLLDRGAITLREQLRDSYKPKIEARVRLTEEYRNTEALEELYDTLSNAPKQLDLVISYTALSNCLREDEIKEVAKRRLLLTADASPSSFNGLVEKGIMEEYDYEVGRLDVDIEDTEEAHELNKVQQVAYNSILESFEKKPVCLLHGVTSSGKTEIYIKLIEQAINKGKQVLYLLPEIALTAQITERLKRVFGDNLGVYHSKFSDAERVEIWKKQLSDNPYKLILGVRSSVFLPFQDLDLLIIDEEHEATYKQQDPAPRYHARDSAIVLAHLFKAKTLLGTATPAIETWFNAQTGKYGLVQLTERFKDIELPEIIAVDIYDLKRKKRMTGQFSPLLLGMMREALENKEQIILFQNRRGFAPMIECNLCGWVPKCTNCDVSLTYHKRLNQLTCHYCGHSMQLPTSCPACNETDLVHRGFGTEKVEDEIKTIFPEAAIARMDLDTTRTRTAYERIISDFQSGVTNVLIGTQMISKGLDFDHVSVVGILNADTMLNYPDFRSYERAYQLMAQVSGRAGRKHKQGRVVLQTRSIDHPIIGQVIGNRYEEMVEFQLEERQLFSYPPFYRLIYVYLKHRDENRLDFMARTMADRLRASFGERVLGPDKPPVGRIQTLYIRKIVLKIEHNSSMKQARSILLEIKERMLADKRFRSLIVYYDVDPM